MERKELERMKQQAREDLEKKKQEGNTKEEKPTKTKTSKPVSEEQKEAKNLLYQKIADFLRKEFIPEFYGMEEGEFEEKIPRYTDGLLVCLGGEYFTVKVTMKKKFPTGEPKEHF